MRIIAGKYGGRILTSFDLDHIRPTTDRVKESVFNILAPQIEGANVLDLFSGTGNLGIESLSRGAKTVKFVERDRRSIQVIQKNLEVLKVEEPVSIVKMDALKFVENYQGDVFDIILIDPPFPLKISLKILEALSDSKAISPQTKIVIEHSKQEPLPDQIKKLSRTDQRFYGDKSVSFFIFGTNAN